MLQFHCQNCQREGVLEADAEGLPLVCRVCLLKAVAAHHAQKADDRCHEDDARLYTAAGLPAADVRVGDKFAMLQNCSRFIDRRCEGGHWPSYAQLEGELEVARSTLRGLADRVAAQSELLAKRADKASITGRAASDLGHLVLSRKLYEKVYIADVAVVELVEIDRGRVRLRISADKATVIDREEVRRHREQEVAG